VFLGTTGARIHLTGARTFRCLGLSAHSGHAGGEQARGMCCAAARLHQRCVRVGVQGASAYIQTERAHITAGFSTLRLSTRAQSAIMLAAWAALLLSAVRTACLWEFKVRPRLAGPATPPRGPAQCPGQRGQRGVKRGPAGVRGEQRERRGRRSCRRVWPATANSPLFCLAHARASRAGSIPMRT
jgi:hypothetical protein